MSQMRRAIAHCTLIDPHLGILLYAQRTLLTLSFYTHTFVVVAGAIDTRDESDEQKWAAMQKVSREYAIAHSQRFDELAQILLRD